MPPTLAARTGYRARVAGVSLPPIMSSLRRLTVFQAAALGQQLQRMLDLTAEQSAVLGQLEAVVTRERATGTRASPAASELGAATPCHPPERTAALGDALEAVGRMHAHLAQRTGTLHELAAAVGAPPLRAPRSLLRADGR